MKKLLNIFFVSLGVIFLALILVGVYLFTFDPRNIKSLFFSNATNVTSTEQVDRNPILSPSQEKALSTFGIDPASVPSSVTPEQEACFTEKLGAERVAEIKAGGVPTVTEFFEARDCI
jgi:hypothetical protein